MGRFAIDFWGVQAAVEWEGAEFDALLEHLWLPIWTNHPDLKPATVFHLSTNSEGAIVLEGPGEDLYPSFRDDVVEILERRLHLHLASETRQAAFVHSGVVNLPGKGAIILPGRSYAGKSTLVQALINAGAEFLSDEYAIIDAQGMVHPFPRPICLRIEGEKDRRISAHQLGWSGSAVPYRAAAIISTSYEEGAEWSPEEISPGNAVLEMMGNTVSAQLAPHIALGCLAKAVDGARLWKGVRGDAETTASRIIERLAD